MNITFEKDPDWPNFWVDYNGRGVGHIEEVGPLNNWRFHFDMGHGDIDQQIEILLAVKTALGNHSYESLLELTRKA
jgi:hypothetical protein